MAGTWYYKLLMYFTLFCYVFCDKCELKGPCRCEFSNGTGIDLSPSTGNPFISANHFTEQKNGTVFKLSSYFFHPCSDAKSNLDPTGQGACSVPLSLCRIEHYMNAVVNSTDSFVMKRGACESLGTQDGFAFNDNGHSIIYNNKPSKSEILLKCADTEDQLDIYSLEEPNDIVLVFYSRNACLKQLVEYGRSTGSTLLIIFFSFVIFYLVLGVCTKKFIMGATSLEVIPNYSFWMDLPNLVKDGWVFALNGFKLPPRAAGSTISPDPNSYDSI